MHEVESIRENLILDLRTAASYELPGRLAPLVLALLVIRGPMRRAARIQPSSAVRYQ